MKLLQGIPQLKSQLAHGYLLEGKDQVRIAEAVSGLAKSVLCSNNQQDITEACHQCKSCQLFDARNHPDFLVVGEQDAAIGIDEVRQITELLFKTAQISPAQFVWIQHAEQMTENARNALLKTLEEPTANSYLFLQTPDKSQLGATILSRCQVLSVSSKSKLALMDAYPELPNYVIGFASGAESKLEQWQENSRVEEFENMYQAFLTWLKGEKSYQLLSQAAIKESELTAFLHYLIERRIRQLMLKDTTQAKGISAMAEERAFNFAQREVKGQNKTLALNAYLQKLEPYLR